MRERDQDEDDYRAPKRRGAHPDLMRDSLRLPLEDEDELSFEQPFFNSELDSSRLARSILT